MPYYAGIDIGASTAKLIIINEECEVMGKALRRSGVDYAAAAEACLNEALRGAGVSRDDIARAVSTGYGRNNVPWAEYNMTEIACHGRGAYHRFPEAITVIDIGAQDSKIIHLDDKGNQVGFKMNRKCAAGTGAFVEEIAHRLGIALGDLDGLARRSTKEVTLGSFCTVFTATEILEKIRAGEKVEDIVKGAFRSVVNRVLEMDTMSGTIVMTGGVIAYNPILAELVEESFGLPVRVPPDPQHTGALGAALFARSRPGGMD